MALIPSLLRKAGVKSLVKSQLELDGRILEVTLRPNHRAKQIILRLDKQGDGVVLTVPPGTSHNKAMEFAASQGPWIWQQLAKQPERIKLAVGEIIPVRGFPHLIVLRNDRRTPVWTEQAPADRSAENVLYVTGDVSHHARRILDWLKKQARQDLTESAFFYAEKMGSKVRRISVRDTSSRWGSCSSNGALSFSWRLIFAPKYVLDYVAAHEVAHLTEMNHSPAFWQLVESHCAETRTAKKWLKSNGRSLHRYGP